MSKKSFIDSVEVQVACDADWASMTGNDKVRFCEHCSKSVNNISELRRKDAMRLVRASNGKLCIRYIPNPVTQRPMFAEQLIQIARRTPRLAAGVMSASLSLSTLAYGQTAPEPDIPEPASVERQSDEMQEVKSDADTEKTGGTIRGIIRDFQGKPLEGVEIYIASDSSNIGESTTTDEDGSYKFDDLEPETYMLRILTAAGDIRKAAPGLVISGAETIIQDLNVRTLVRHVEPGSGEGSGSGMGSGTGGASISIAYRLPLNDAVANNDLEKVKALLESGEKANGKDSNYSNITPLFLAVENGNIEITRLLIQYGAKVNARDTSKRTPLMFIDNDATPELIQVLLRAGAKVNTHDENGDTPLHIAAYSSTVEVVKALIDGGAELNAANDAGKTPLMQAVDVEDPDTVDALIVAGADITLKDKNGETAWDLTSDPIIEKALVAAGAVASYDVEVEVIIVDDVKDSEPETTPPVKAPARPPK